MDEREAVIGQIQKVFGENHYPGDAFLRGSREGEEPYEVAVAFRGKREWQALDGAFLETEPAALSFFSEAAFRFYLPAYLIADLGGELQQVDVLFHLTHGFSDDTVTIPLGSTRFTKKIGRSAFVNPGRYGAMTHFDYARYRLSIFNREEAEAIVAYLEWKQVRAASWEQARIEKALDSFWRERAAGAPTAERIREHLAEEARYLAALSVQDFSDEG
jgi:hypothetical protein